LTNVVLLSEKNAASLTLENIALLRFSGSKYLQLHGAKRLVGLQLWKDEPKSPMRGKSAAHLPVGSFQQLVDDDFCTSKILWRHRS
jgi:hypothetical protein